jgi:hypothetical protein
MTAEHLMAIALKTGRGKDFIRLEQFVQGKIFDKKNWMKSSRATIWLRSGNNSTISMSGDE